jgi:hypothetical protein
MFVFSGFRKSDLIKSCSSFEYVRAYKIPLYHVDWCNFCIHLRCLKHPPFGMVEATGLKITASMPPSMACPLYGIYKNLPTGSKFYRVKDTQTAR